MFHPCHLTGLVMLSLHVVARKPAIDGNPAIAGGNGAAKRPSKLWRIIDGTVQHYRYAIVLARILPCRPGLAWFSHDFPPCERSTRNPL